MAGAISAISSRNSDRLEDPLHRCARADDVLDPVPLGQPFSQLTGFAPEPPALQRALDHDSSSTTRIRPRSRSLARADFAGSADASPPLVGSGGTRLRTSTPRARWCSRWSRALARLDVLDSQWPQEAELVPSGLNVKENDLVMFLPPGKLRLSSTSQAVAVWLWTCEEIVA
jgi:hypothetical protein